MRQSQDTSVAAVLLRWFLVLAVAAIFAACSQSNASWKLLDIEGVMKPLEFNLTNGSGEAVTAEDYQGKVTLLYFGYTHCPDVCPTTLATLAHTLDMLGDDARNVQVLFVSVDPQRDTPQVLKRYTAAFGPEFTGLTGSDSQLRRLTKRYRVTFSHGEPDADGDYEVTHSSAVFIFDPQGEARLMARSDDPPQAIRHDLEQLLAGS